MTSNREETAPNFLEGIADAIVVVDYDGLICVVNKQTEDLFGYLSDELLGQPVEVLVPDRTRAAHPHHRALYYINPSRRPMGAGLQLSGKHKSGSEFPCDIALAPIEIEGAPMVLATIRDMSDRKKYETVFVSELTGNVAQLNESVTNLATLFAGEQVRVNRRRRNDILLFGCLFGILLLGIVAQGYNFDRQNNAQSAADTARRSACIAQNDVNATLRALFQQFRRVEPTPIPAGATPEEVANIRRQDEQRQKQTDQFFAALDERTKNQICPEVG